MKILSIEDIEKLSIEDPEQLSIEDIEKLSIEDLEIYARNSGLVWWVHDKRMAAPETVGDLTKGESALAAVAQDKKGSWMIMALNGPRSGERLIIKRDLDTESILNIVLELLTQPKPEGKAGTQEVQPLAPSLIVPTPDVKLSPEGITWTNREGQDDFRRLVIQAYGRCAITDCIDEIALQAAHIIPYVNATSNLVQNGICLRADIHCLFDRGLVIIGEDFVVTVSSDVASAEYRRLSGRRLHLPTERALWPDLVLLRERSRWISA